MTKLVTTKKYALVSLEGYVELEENTSKLKSEVMEIYSQKQSDMGRTTQTLNPKSEVHSSERKVHSSAMPRARSSSSKQFVLPVI